ncbi:hypothetical protein [Humibacter ginsenosidimutans]|uniref:Uncharacterized protein n=1 Tax=Humibacter ginsenosidimutans TaxID=2599293 RepID=A0A5B8M859_9MICO|nr:hypothetical protein [Humibacter ginsenosidimutans]QDZ15782.1 hypothetical protein FPZ11_14330 [Humibacter ginsenosidimutans]
MSADDMAEFYIQTAIVETCQGTNGYGEDIFASAVTLDPAADNGCWIDDTRHLVRSTDGEQVMSESTLYTYPANAPLFAPNSRVTVNGDVSRVIKTNLNTSGDLDLPDHVAVSLT